MAMNNKKESPHAHQQALRDYFHFDELDIEANRLGQFSARQKEELKAYREDSRRSSLKVGVIVTGVGLALLFLMTVLFFAIDSGFDWVDVVNNLSLILVTLAFLSIGIYSLLGGRKARVETSKHKVEHVEGSVDIVEVRRFISRYSFPNRRHIIYELRIGKKEFSAYEELPAVMTLGDVYCIYFDGADDEILSVEWISKG